MRDRQRRDGGGERQCTPGRCRGRCCGGMRRARWDNTLLATLPVCASRMRCSASEASGAPLIRDRTEGGIRKGPGLQCITIAREARGTGLCPALHPDASSRHRPGGRLIRYEFPRVSPSGTGRVRPDTTRVSPPTLGAGFRNRSTPAPPGGAHVPPSLAARATAGVRVHHIFTCQTARQTSLIAPGRARLPAAVQSCPPRKHEDGEAPQSAGAETAAPGGRLAVGPVPSSEGTAGP